MEPEGTVSTGASNQPLDPVLSEMNLVVHKLQPCLYVCCIYFPRNLKPGHMFAADNNRLVKLWAWNTSAMN
jgi:hypothetical protein